MRGTNSFMSMHTLQNRCPSPAGPQVPPAEEDVHGRPGGVTRLVGAEVPPPEGGAGGGETEGSGRLQTHAAREDRARGGGAAVANGAAAPESPDPCRPATAPKTCRRSTETFQLMSRETTRKMCYRCIRGLMARQPLGDM